MVGCSLVNFEKHVEENGLILKIKIICFKHFMYNSFHIVMIYK